MGGSLFSASERDIGAVNRSLTSASLFKFFLDEVNCSPTSSEPLVTIPFSGRSFSIKF